MTFHFFYATISTIRENAEMKRVHVLESYREFPDGLIGPDAERDRGWGMEDGFGAAWMNTKW